MQHWLWVEGCLKAGRGERGKKLRSEISCRSLCVCVRVCVCIHKQTCACMYCLWNAIACFIPLDIPCFCKK